MSVTVSKRAIKQGVRSFHASSVVLKRKILISDPIEQSCVDILEKGGFEVTRRDKVPKDEMLKIIKDYDGLIVRSGTTVTGEILKAGTNLKLIGRAGTGVDNIDVDTATRLGKMVMNTPGGNTASAAELTVSLLMALSRRIPEANASLKGGKWDRKKFMGTELAEKTIGIVGLGQIGRRVAQSCQGLGMKTIGYDPLLSEEVARENKIKLVSLEDLYKHSDVISLHTPLTAETRKLFNDETLAKCKDGVRLINCARGGIIDEAALLRALKSGKVAGAALDVFEKEPPGPEAKELLAHPDIICTPHLGASTEEAQEKVATEIARQFVDAFDGARYSGIVNAKILSIMHQRKDLVSFVELAERLGSLQAQLLSGTVRAVTITTKGGKLKDSTDIVTAAAVKGLLSKLVSEPVNYVNAQLLAGEFGLQIRMVHEAKSSLNGDTVSVVVETDAGKRELVGSVRGEPGNERARLVQLDDYRLEMVPEGHAIFFSNLDKPGLMGRVCTILGENGINISGFYLGRNEVGGKAVGVVSIDSDLSHEVLEKLRRVPNMMTVTLTNLPAIEKETPAQISGTSSRPTVRPNNPNFGSGPTTKFPGFNLAKLPTRALGRSHRSALGKGMLLDVIEQSKRILQMPKDYRLAIMPASDTGAFEAAMWGLLGPRPVDVAFWESFGKGWYTDAVSELKLDAKAGGPGVRPLEADYGKLPDLTKISPEHDVVFTWNGTTSGVKVPNADWIPANRQGLTLCDATSAVFSMRLDWEKLDVVTWSWQKVLGGEGAHGMLALSPRAVERLNTHKPKWPMPKLFKLTKSGKLMEDVFQGNVINTPSMLAVEDCLAALAWAERSGGLDGLVRRSEKNLQILTKFASENPWIKFLADDPAQRSSTSICFKINLPADKIKKFTKKLEEEGVAYDIGSYRSAPAGIRIWGGSTVEAEDVAALTHWLKWAYEELRDQQ